MATFSKTRVAQRLLPRSSVTVSISTDENSTAYGVVQNISETGACMVTDKRFAHGESLSLKISFYRHAEILETGARIIWTRESIEPLEAHRLVGVRFLHLSQPDRSKLQEVLGSEEFDKVPDPQGDEAFEKFLNDLLPDLDRLGGRLSATKDRW